MPVPTTAAAAATIAKKIPRGALLRLGQELRAKREEIEAPVGHPIALPLFIFLFMLSVGLDLMTLVPIAGSIFNFIVAPLVWFTYYFVGAKGLAGTLKWLIGFLMGTGYLTELIPVLNMLPINTVICLAVYILMHPKVAERISRAIEGTPGRLTAALAKSAPVQKVAQAAKELVAAV